MAEKKDKEGAAFAIGGTSAQRDLTDAEKKAYTDRKEAVPAAKQLDPHARASDTYQIEYNRLKATPRVIPDAPRQARIVPVPAWADRRNFRPGDRYPAYYNAAHRGQLIPPARIAHANVNLQARREHNYEEHDRYQNEYRGYEEQLKESNYHGN